MRDLALQYWCPIPTSTAAAAAKPCCSWLADYILWAAGLSTYYSCDTGTTVERWLKNHQDRETYSHLHAETEKYIFSTCQDVAGTSVNQILGNAAGHYKRPDEELDWELEMWYELEIVVRGVLSGGHNHNLLLQQCPPSGDRCCQLIPLRNWGEQEWSADQ